MTVNKRAALRFVNRLELKEINQKPGAGVFLLDISAVGARIDAPFAPALWSLVEFTLSPPGEECIVTFKGKVIWMRPVISSPGRFSFGVDFLQPRWDVDQMARKWLNQVDLK
jgi:hypothetical protein